jgi:hypothetical protein
MMGEAFAERPFAGCRRPVDGDDHACHVHRAAMPVKAGAWER